MKQLSNEEKYLLETMRFDDFLSCIGECECKTAKELAKQIASKRNNRCFDNNHVEPKQTTITFK